MPTYTYYCPTNDVEADVFHAMSFRVESWGQLRELAGLEDDATPPEARVERRITAGLVMTRGKSAPPPAGGCGTGCGCH